jgi:hypothetical protein
MISKENVSVTYKDMKIFSTSLVNKEMETARRVHFISYSMFSIQKIGKKSVSNIGSNWNPQSMILEMQNGVAILENNLHASELIKYRVVM